MAPLFSPILPSPVYQHPASTVLHAPPRLHDLRKSRHRHRLRGAQSSQSHNLRPRQDDASNQPPTPTLTTSMNASIPSVSLLPSSQPSIHGMPHGSSDVVFIAVGSAIAVLLIFVSIILFVRVHWCSLSSAFKCCYRHRRPKKSRFLSSKKIGLPMPLGDDPDDPYVNTPTTFVYVERFDGPPQLQLETTESYDLFISTQTALDRLLPEENAQEAEKHKPILDHGSEHHDSHSVGSSHRLSSPPQMKIAHKISCIGSRPRGTSNASRSSGESEDTEETDVTVLFSPALIASCRSSMTSVASLASASDGGSDDEYDEAFEVKHAHSHSIEYKRGVLVAWPSHTTGLSTSSSAPERSPSIVISEPSPAAKSSSCGTIYSLSASCSSRLAAENANMRTTASISSLVCENSVGTVSSISSAFSLATRSETSCAAAEDQLRSQPRIPFLMVTEPSSSSIYTMSTQTSSVSVDLNDFPLPLAVAKPAKPLYLKLMEQAKSHALEAQRRAWRNHPENSSLKQRRSTVEQFIMMYTNA